MKLYNTLSRQLEEFTPTDPEDVKIYTCGPTVYSYQHIGNYTAYIYWDILVRALSQNNYKVRRILNITDVGHLSSDADEGEDKLVKGAKREGKTVWEIAEFYGDDFLRNFRALNLIEPTKITKATDYIEANINLVNKLKDKGYTYETTDGIYYDTSKFSIYADFAHLDLKNLKAGARVEFNPEKRHPSDFALWKFIKPGEDHAMRWDYLDRPGYPGWHIECSAIIHAELGEPIDIHTGGIDHIPIHHTNEIAQSEAAFDKTLSKFWLHNNFITIDGQKISKSLGNVYLFTDLKERGFTHMDFKLWAIQGHYQSERSFSFDDLAAAKQRLIGYRNFAALRHQDTPISDELEQTKQHILSALNDNLSTPQALTILDELINNHLAPDADFIEFLDNCLGLNLYDSTSDITQEQKDLIEKRESARAKKDYAESDKTRAELAEQNINILDTENGSIWQYLG
jgi:cysteinyl-tRNA synthetase